MALRRRLCLGDNCVGNGLETEHCNLGRCQQQQSPCQEWLQWSPCSVTCGAKSVQQRLRFCGDYRSPEMEHRKCAINPCPRSRTATWLLWGQWSPCSASCGFGTRMKIRDCASYMHCEGPNTKSEICDSGICPVSVDWSPWSAWSTCSVTCGDLGLIRRERKCPVPGQCRGNELGMSVCDPGPCQGDLGDWAPWAACSSTCGLGYQVRSKICPGYTQCPRETFDTKRCDLQPCTSNYSPKQATSSSQWGAWGACSSSCGTGEKMREKQCPIHNRCSDAERLEFSPCNDGPCPDDDEWTAWSTWSLCTVTCDSGMRVRVRLCISDHGCTRSKSVTETEECRNQPCLIDSHENADG